MVRSLFWSLGFFELVAFLMILVSFIPSLGNEKKTISQEPARIDVVLTWSGWTLVALGVITMIGQFLSVVFGNTSEHGLLDASLGLFAVGFGLVAFNISLKSDDKMSTLAGLEFDEKMGMLDTHIKRILEKPQEVACGTVLQDVKACVRLRRWIKRTEVDELKRKLAELSAAIDQHNSTCTSTTYNVLYLKIGLEAQIAVINK